MWSISILLAVLLVSCAHAAVTPYSVPFLGTNIPTPTDTPATVSIGEVITAVSQITSFSFFVSGVGGNTGTATISLWNTATNAPSGSPLASINIILPTNAPTFYVLTTATVNLAGLQPTSLYVIYFTLPSTLAQQYRIATAASTTGPIGGYVNATNGVWYTGFSKDVLFDLVSTNTMALTFGNYAIGTGWTSINYNCMYNTTYTCIQANWQTNLINSAYTGCASSVLITTSSCPTPPYIPYGYANTCYWNQFYFTVDLRGTNYYVTSNWTAAGWPSNQLGSYTSSNNNQTVVGYVNGDCSGIAPGSAPNDVGPGGFYIQLAVL